MHDNVLEPPHMSSRLRSRAGLIALLSLFLGPLVLATLWYSMVDELRPSGHVNHGTLLSPMTTLAGLSLRHADGSSLPADWILGRWTLVQVGGARCDLYCEAALFKTRQAQAMLGRDEDRVQRLYVLSEPAGPGVRALFSEHPGMEVVTGTREQLEPLLTALPGHAHGTVYLVDPLGNVMMRYDATATTKGVVKDLQRLLKVSKIG